MTDEDSKKVSFNYTLHRKRSISDIKKIEEYADCIYAKDPDTPIPNECSGYDTKAIDKEAPVLGLQGMWSTLSLLLFPGPL